ncbi:unnamed protein product [Absidia cylindrospora]
MNYGLSVGPHHDYFQLRSSDVLSRLKMWRRISQYDLEQHDQDVANEDEINPRSDDSNDNDYEPAHEPHPSAKKGKQSAATKAAKRKARQQEQAERRSNKKCQKCIDTGKYDESKPHANTGSRNCYHHEKTKLEVINAALGPGSTKRTRKISLNEFLYENEDCNRLYQAIQNAVIINSEIYIKTHLYVCYFLQVFLQNQPMPFAPRLFTANWWYNIFGLLCGRQITDTTDFTDQERHHHEFTYQHYIALFPDGGFVLPHENESYSKIRNNLAVNASTAITNNMVENFRARSLLYIKLRLYALAPLFPRNKLRHYMAHVYDLRPQEQVNINIEHPDEATRNQLQNALEQIATEFPAVLRPLTLGNLSRHKGDCMRFMFTVLGYIQNYNAQQFQQNNDVQTSAEFSWGRSVVRGYQPIDAKGSQAKTRLTNKILYLVNHPGITIDRNYFPDWLDEGGIDHFVAVVTQARHQIANSHLFIDAVAAGNDPEVTMQQCFLPEYDATLNQQRGFHLVPYPTVQMKHITINYDILKNLSNIGHVQGFPRIPSGGFLDQSDKLIQQSQLFQYYFNFGKVNLISRNTIFNNLIKTDGFSVSVIFAQAMRPFHNTRLEPTDFSREDLSCFRFWGVDPGIKQVLVAVDGSGDNGPHEIRKLNTVEYYNGAMMQRHANETHEFRHRIGIEGTSIAQVEQTIQSSNVTSIDDMVLHITSRLAPFRRLFTEYAQHSRPIKFHTYVTRQIMDENLIKLFIGDGGTKYRANQEQMAIDDTVFNHGKWRKLPSYSQPKIPVVCVGNAIFADTMRGTLPSLVKRMKKLLVEADNLGRLAYMEIDEYLTSQRCSFCFRLTLEHVTVENGDSLFGVLRCRSCRKIWQRDVNAARNIHSVVMHQIATNTNERPHNLERPVTQQH